MVTESAVNIAKEYQWSLPPELDVKRAYIFGSYAKGKGVNLQPNPDRLV
jgi:predicted nucleotidyltransferase